jgi:UDP-glucose 4-epimerase
VDNFVNSSPRVLDRLQALLGAPPVFERADVCDAAAMFAIAQRHRIDAAVHFAALKAVGESTRQPLAYYRNNLGGVLATCDALGRAGAKRFVFSSSATVYGQPKSLPIAEDAPLAATNPYGQTKLMAEQMLGDLRLADAAWRIASLRYFNPVGAHESGSIGEDPRGVPNNLMPYVAQVAVGRRPHLQIFGNDYDTPDGTGVRDYIHVMDLAEGHVAAVSHLLGSEDSMTLNLGTGRGASVLDLVRAYERASGRAVPYVFGARRPGDVAACYADPSRASAALSWQARRDLDQMCADSWRWQSSHPDGFGNEV